jgi:hypothetical protein
VRSVAELSGRRLRGLLPQYPGGVVASALDPATRAYDASAYRRPFGTRVVHRANMERDVAGSRPQAPAPGTTSRIDGAPSLARGRRRIAVSRFSVRLPDPYGCRPREKGRSGFRTATRTGRYFVKRPGSGDFSRGRFTSIAGSIPTEVSVLYPLSYGLPGCPTRRPDSNRRPPRILFAPATCRTRAYRTRTRWDLTASLYYPRATRGPTAWPAFPGYDSAELTHLPGTLRRSSCHGCILGSRIRNVKGVAGLRRQETAAATGYGPAPVEGRRGTA